MHNDYNKQAEQFLNAANIDFSFVLIGSDCPPFCEDARKRIDMDKVDVFPRKTHIHGKHYRCTFTRRTGPIGREAEWQTGKWLTGTLVIDFWNSYADEEFNAWRFGKIVGERDYPYWDKFNRERFGKGKTPTPYSVLACITKYDPGTFENFCSNFGSDPDSRQALATFEAVQSEYKRVAAFFTEAELTLAQDIS